MSHDDFLSLDPAKRRSVRALLIAPALKHLGPVVHAHAKDWERLPDNADSGLTSRCGRKYIGTVVGSGVLDYPAIVGLLKAMDYRGFLSFEYEGRGDPVAAARQGMAVLRDLVG